MLQGPLANLRVQRLKIRRLRWRFRPAKHVRGPCEQLLLPFGDLGGMDVELLGQFRHSLLTFDGGQRHLGLKGRSVIPSRSFRCLAPLFGHLAVALVKPGYHLSHCPIFRSPL